MHEKPSGRRRRRYFFLLWEISPLKNEPLAAAQLRELDNGGDAGDAICSVIVVEFLYTITSLSHLLPAWQQRQLKVHEQQKILINRD